MSKKDDFKKQIYGNPNWVNGRMNRAEYFWRGVGTAFLYAVSAVMAVMLYGFFGIIPAALMGGVAVWMYWRILMIYVKRLHDLGWTGWLVVLLIFPELEKTFIKSITLYWILILLSFVLSLFLLFRKGDNGANKYGKDPLMKYEENQ